MLIDKKINLSKIYDIEFEKIPALKPGERLIWYIDVGEASGKNAMNQLIAIQKAIFADGVLPGEQEEQHIFIGCHNGEKDAVLAVLPLDADDTQLKLMMA